MSEDNKPQLEKQESPKSDIEIRDISPDLGELRLDDGDVKKLVGYATRYGNFYDLGWLKERVKEDAFDDVLEDDVRCLKNHDPNLILGRTASGTLQLKSNSLGLKFENDIPNTSTGRDTSEEIRRGDISGCSFSFTVEKDEWEYFEDGRPAERTIVKIGKLFDVGPVVYPANPKTSVIARDTDVARRSLDDHLKSAAGGQEQRQGDESEDREKKYECECIECGHTVKTKKHCKDIKCSECGGKMRRKERPGPGREGKAGEEKIKEETEEQRKQRRKIDKGYAKVVRIQDRVNRKIAESKQ